MAYKYDIRHVQHGNDYGIFIPIDSDCSSGSLTYGCAYEYTGLISTSFETTQESTQYYADNVEHISLRGIATTTGSLTVYQIRKEFMTGPLGKTLLDSGAYIDTGTPVNFVWIFKETVTNSCGEEYPLWHIYTNCQASAPTGSTTTDGTSATPKEITIPITCSPNDSVVDPNTGKSVTVIDIPDKDGAFKTKIDNLFDSTGACPGSETMDSIFTYILTGSDVTPPDSDPTEPSAPVITTTSDGTQYPEIDWTAVSGATTYNIYRAETGGTLTVLASAVTGTSYTDSSAVAGTTYDYAVTAVNTGGESAQSNVLTIAYNPVAAPTTAPTLSDTTATGATEPTISWTSVTGATSYTVYRGDSTGANMTALVSNLTDLTYTDDTAVAGTTYTYSVTASNSGGEGPQSNQVTITTPGTTPTVPDQVTNVVATSGTTAGEIDLSWDAVTGATSYNIYETTSSTDTSPLSSSAVETGITGTSYTMTGLTSGTTYYFTVSAVNSVGEGTQSSLTTGVAAP